MPYLKFILYCLLENLALRRPTWMENIFPGKIVEWGASKAVDGRYTDRGGKGNQCTISDDGKQTATWRVDLGSIVSISHIKIYHRTDNKPSPTVYVRRFAGFFLYVSNTTLKEDGHVCFHAIQRVNGTPVEDQTIYCSVQGRYVIFYNERRPDVTYPSYYTPYAYTDLCELEVYGCRDPRYYGDNCDQSCPAACQERRCDVITGDCLGCISGYQGLKCRQVCNEQTYGPQCALSCGNCRCGYTCHHINGTCLNGCDEGVEGEKCQNECQPGYYGRDCKHECSINCGVTRRCDRFIGECEGGCQPGWKGEQCDTRMYPFDEYDIYWS
ncbi:multiple epidermal growth factor-like domains protein 11 [Saccostrea echinata]|uniref:multiple epidermal growth factor-like domains protein 11 n=1 Tax=Saccostrea echinata TaxID=191078 RepID=UPI002A8315BD|nr:multiple epidermal growth factor-like domains protein 11 [Saccostrea echinata]